MPFVLTTMNVSDLNRSLEFYCGLLGLPVAGRIGAPEDGFAIAFLGEADGTRLELVQGYGAPMPSEAISVGVVPKDLQAVLEACKDHAEGPIRPNPHTVFWFVRDPDGYRVQLFEKA